MHTHPTPAARQHPVRRLFARSSGRRHRLRRIWQQIEGGSRVAHTSVVVPSLSFDQQELAKIRGHRHYEERLLVSLLRLRDPRARVVYLTSQPVHPDIVAYYLDMLPATIRQDASDRLRLFAAYDSSNRALTTKILERPRLLARVRAALGDGSGAYLTCFNPTKLEAQLAEELDLPLNGADPSLAWIGTKAGARRVFAEANCATPYGIADVRSRTDVIDALSELGRHVPGIRQAVIKLNEGFSGAGNAIFQFDRGASGPRLNRDGLRASLRDLRTVDGGSAGGFLDRLQRHGGIVEHLLEGDRGEPAASPSVQLRITPEGAVQVLSTHDQVLEGNLGQTYVGCRFPADARYRSEIHAEAMRVGKVLAARGVIGRFGVDFVVTDPGQPFAIEINLRMGGTTFPFMAMSSLVPGELGASGEFMSNRGIAKSYFATDNLRDPAYVGLSPEDFLEIVHRRGLCFDARTETGPVFHMIGALSEFGRVGVTCIADSGEEASEMYQHVVSTLDEECSGGSGRWLKPTHPFGLPIAGME